MNRNVKRAVVLLITSSILNISCSKSTSEPVVQERLSAESIMQTKEDEYQYLEKISLRKEKRISHPFFFKDYEIEKDTAFFSEDGLAANIQLLEDSEMEQFYTDTVNTKIKELSAFASAVTQTKDNEYVTEFTYQKETIVSESGKSVVLQYPCIQLLATFRQADGCWIFLQVSVDNEYSTDRTEKLYKEILYAYGIVLENN